MRASISTRPLAVLALTLAVGLLIVAPQVTEAAPGMGTGTTCFPGTVATSFGYTTFHNCTAETSTPSGGLSVAFRARVAAPSVPPAQTVRLSGFACLTSHGLTTNSMVTISPDGQVGGSCLLLR